MSSRTHRWQGDTAPTKDARRTGRSREDRLISLIEAKDTILRYESLVKKIADGAKGIPDFFKAAALDAAIVTTDIMLTGENDKVRLEAAKDVLDRAGHGKTQKVSVSGSVQVDHDTSKLELMNMILASARKAGIKVRDDAPLLEARPADQVIDVTPREEAPVGVDEAPPEGT